ncbi:MAG: PfkB family carbohydrate kinase [Bacteroidetes bacterium]|nr:PfkB family carbohydrate kinase [Bacteroidota bacterium]
MSLLVVGSVAVDDIETPFGKVKFTIGGAATFISIISSYFCSKINLVGVVGSDFPKEGIKIFKNKKIDLKGLEVIENGKTFHWGGKYLKDINIRKTLFTDLNVFQKFDPIIPTAYKKSKYICLGNIDPVLQKKVVSQIENPKLIVCDTMNYWIENKLKDLKAILKLVDVLIINDSEVRMLANESNIITSAKKVLRMGPKILVIKRGEHGSSIITDSFIYSIPAFPTEKVVDPTGAGDTFAGGFISYIASKKNISDDILKNALINATIASSFCVEGFGINGIKKLNKKQIKDRITKFNSLIKPPKL